MRVSLVARTLVALSVAMASTALGGLARADDRVRARLSYAPDSDIEHCPTDRELKDAVASRIGYDPFDGAPDDAREVHVEVHRRAGGIVGLLELRGPKPGQRELGSPRGDCRELLDTLAVAIAIGLDPASLTRPAGPPVGVDEAPAPLPTPVVAPSTPPAPAPERPLPPPSSRDTIDVRLGGGPVLLFGELPAAAPGLAASIAFRWRWVEPGLEAFATLPVSQGARMGKASASLLGATVLPCGHAQLFFGCLGLTLGALRGEGEGVVPAMSGSQLYAAVSARAGVELALTQAVWLRGSLEAVAPLTRITLQLAAEDVWRTPSVAARAGANLGVSF